MRLDYLEHEHAVGGDKLRIVELALEARVAFLDQRRADVGSRDCGQSKLGEFVDVSSRAVADAHDLGSEIDGRDVDDALAAVSDHLEAVVLVPDIAANQRRLEAHDHVPAHSHDVGLAASSRTHQHDRPRLEIAPHVVYQEVSLVVFAHAAELSPRAARTAVLLNLFGEG